MLTFDAMKTEDPVLLSIIDRAKCIADTNLNILISGENGTGKTLLSQSIYMYEKKDTDTFLYINCSSIQHSFQDIIVSQDKMKHTTICLSELGDLTLHEQNDLLDILKKKLCSRIISLTTKDMVEKLKQGLFSLDLYYKLNELHLDLPALRQRKKDVPLLIDHFLETFNVTFQKKVKEISQIGLNHLMHYDWPGNIKQLENMIKTAVALSNKDVLWLEDIPFQLSLDGRDIAQTHTDYSLQHAEKIHIEKVLRMCRWNKAKASRLLGISRPRLDRKISEYLLKKQD